MMATPPPRVVTLVLVGGDGIVLGALPPFEAETPWWMDIGPVVRAVRQQCDLRVTVLRLLGTERLSAHGGAVSYLAQVDATQPLTSLQPWRGDLPEDPKRRAYARVGGPQADLAWATTVLQAQADAPTGEPEQIRTWNLSSIWRIPTRAGAVWLKVVPPFFAHEGRVLEALAGAPVPRLIGHDGWRLLLAHAPGEDGHGAKLAERLPMIDLLVGLQHDWLGRTETLRGLGLPDWRGPALSAAVSALIERRADAVTADDRAPLDAFVAGLPARLAAVAACGIADTLVHGDFHQGNVRSDGRTRTLIDWGDSGVGHPLLDMPAFLGATPEEEHEATRAHWFAAWRRALPDADIERAARLLAPIAMARQALVYQNFLDGIEAAEQPYHRNDVPEFLHRSADCMRHESDA
jgi:Phosphotransferase enzyme family